MLNRRRPSQTARPNAAQQPPVDEWRRYRRALRWRLGLIVPLLALVAVALIALNSGGRGGLPAFNACIQALGGKVWIVAGPDWLDTEPLR